MTALSIFRRVFLGYMVIMLLSAGISSYAIIQLRELSNTAHTALEGDNRMIAYQQTLTDVFLSEVRYGGKFVITHTAGLYDQYRQFKNDFERYAGEMQALAPTNEIQARLSRVREFHFRYGHLLEREAAYIKARQNYAASRYQNERDKTMESALKELEILKAQLQKHLLEKLQTIETSATGARKLAILATFILLAVGIALSLRISRTITTPISELKRHIMRTAGTPAQLDFGRIPEIHELAQAWERAREQLQNTSENNIRFARTVSELIETPLISIRARLNYLKSSLTGGITQEQRDSLEVLCAETDRLIHHCNGIRPPAIAELESREFDASNALTIAPKPVASRWPLLAKNAWSGAVNRLAPVAKPVVESINNFFLRARINFLDSIKQPRQRKAKKQ